MKLCNQGAKPLQGSGAAAPKCRGFGRSLQYAEGLGGAAPQSAERPGDAAPEDVGAAPPGHRRGVQGAALLGVA